MIEILELKAGRELDAKISERVLGIPCFYWQKDGIGAKDYIGEHSDKPIPYYSTDISAAWEVVEKVRERGWVLDITLGVAAYCRIHGLRSGEKNWPLLGESSEETFPLAICLAALQAVES